MAKSRALRELLRGPTLKLDSGEEASEMTQTIKTPKGWVNVPTINPKRKQSIKTSEGLKEEQNKPGGPKYYETLEDALKGAKKRSESGGRYGS